MHILSAFTKRERRLAGLIGLAVAVSYIAWLVLMLSGCGSGSTPPPPPSLKTLTWASNGNPLVPICNALPEMNCLSGYTIEDLTTTTQYAIAITALSYTPQTPTDAFEIRVDGFDYRGNAIYSPWAVFDAATGTAAVRRLEGRR
jgi:hypothetical protein